MINDYIDYYDVDYIYAIGSSTSNFFGEHQNYTSTTRSLKYYTTKNDLISAMLRQFADNFESDREKVNDGYPILKWQNTKK